MTFQWPSLLLLLGLLPILFLFYFLAQRRRRAYAVRFTNLALLSEVVSRGPGRRRHIPPFLYLLGLSAILFSLARPEAVIAVPRDEGTVLLVIDVSGSMTAADLQPNRLEAAKQAAHQFVEALPTDTRIGVLSFSSTARVNAPPTRDREVVHRAVDSLSAGGGTAIGDGLELALDQLAAAPEDVEGQGVPGLIVLLSDGRPTAGKPPREVAARAAQEQVKVHTVGIGQRGASPVVVGRVRAELDETTLQEIARETGGEYFYADRTSELERIYANLGSQVRWVEERTEITVLASAVGSVFLIAAGLLSLRWFQQIP